LDLAVAKALADLVSVDAAVTQDGKVIYANPTLRKRMWEDHGWQEADERMLWEMFGEEHEAQVKEWYTELKARDDRYGILEVRTRSEDAPPETEKVYALRFEDRELVVTRSADSQPVMERFSELETMTRMFRSYLKDGVLGLMVLQDEGGREGVVRYISPEGARILEREVSDISGKEISGFLSLKDVDVAMERYRGRMRGQRIEPNQEVEFKSSTGDTLMLDVVVGSTTWQGEPAAYCLFKDKTSEHLMVEELRRFAQGFEMIQDTMVLADKNFNILYVNPTGLKRSGYTFEEVLGKPAYIFASTQTDEVDPLVLAQDLVEKGYWTGERTAATKDGRQYPVEIDVSLSKDPKGDPEMITVISRDITERKEGERALLRARERAEFFTDLMSHDINNYIQGVMGWLELLSRSELEDELKDQVGRAQEQADRISELIDRVRVLSKAQHAEELKPVNLSVVMEEALSDLHQRYSDRECDLRTEGLEGPVMVLADDLLKDLVINVVDNAIKFSVDGGPRVDIKVRHQPTKEAERIRISVSDRGPGIPDEDKSSVFYRFVRKTEGMEGSGLGLSLVNALTDRYNGKVWIEDRVRGSPDEGAKIIIELPGA
jgi:PAS domain S-box-containing protein